MASPSQAPQRLRKARREQPHAVPTPRDLEVAADDPAVAGGRGG